LSPRHHIWCIFIYIDTLQFFDLLCILLVFSFFIHSLFIKIFFQWDRRHDRSVNLSVVLLPHESLAILILQVFVQIYLEITLTSLESWLIILCIIWIQFRKVFLVYLEVILNTSQKILFRSLQFNWILVWIFILVDINIIQMFHLVPLLLIVFFFNIRFLFLRIPLSSQVWFIQLTFQLFI